MPSRTGRRPTTGNRYSAVRRGSGMRGASNTIFITSWPSSLTSTSTIRRSRMLCSTSPGSGLIAASMASASMQSTSRCTTPTFAIIHRRQRGEKDLAVRFPAASLQSVPPGYRQISRARPSGDRSATATALRLPRSAATQALNEMQAFTAGAHRLNSAYGFDFLYADALTPQLVARVAQEWPEHAGWPTWAFENHDAPRAVSRWVDGVASGEFGTNQDPPAELPARIDHRLPGRGTRTATSRCAIREASGSRSDRQLAANSQPRRRAHPDGVEFEGPQSRIFQRRAMASDGREPSRTGRRSAGDGPEHSSLAFTRKSLGASARTSRALRLGSMRIIEAGEQTLAFERSDRGELLRCTFNLSDRPVSFTPSGEEADRKPGASTMRRSDPTPEPSRSCNEPASADCRLPYWRSIREYRPCSSCAAPRERHRSVERIDADAGDGA